MNVGMRAGMVHAIKEAAHYKQVEQSSQMIQMLSKLGYLLINNARRCELTSASTSSLTPPETH